MYKNNIKICSGTLINSMGRVYYLISNQKYIISQDGFITPGRLKVGYVQ